MGVPDDHLFVPGQHTGLRWPLESDDRDRTFLTYLGVNADWGPDMIPADALRCDELLFCDYFVAPALRGEGGRGLLADAQAHGARTFFDTAWDPGGFPAPARAE